VTIPLLGVLFLDHLLELVRSLAQLRKGLLYGIVFFSAFLSGAEIGFFRSVFLETTAMVSIVRCVRAPMLLAKVAVFLGTSFPRDSGTLPVPGCTYPFYRCVKVSRRKKRRTCWIFPGHTSCCAKLSCREKHWTYRIFPGHIRAWLPRETEGVNACLQESHLSCEGWTDPAACTGMFVGLASMSLVGFGFLFE